LQREASLRNQPNLNVFPLSEAMLERQVTIGAMDIALKTYDLAVFAAVLVKSEELRRDGCDWVGFCELDSDLQPWDKFGDRKPILSDLYNDSRIWVYGDFLLPEGCKLKKLVTSKPVDYSGNQVRV
jgi:hypothetical protein